LLTVVIKMSLANQGQILIFVQVNDS